MIRTTIQGIPSATNMILTYDIVEKLKRAYCSNGVILPTVNITWATSDTQLVGTTLYATIQATINVTYQPKCSRNLTTNTFAESFIVSFANAEATSAITLSNTNGYTDPTYLNACNCNSAQGIEQVGTLSITMG